MLKKEAQTHLVQEVELRDVGDLRVQQLVGDVEDSLLHGELEIQKHKENIKYLQEVTVTYLSIFLLSYIYFTAVVTFQINISHVNYTISVID